MKITMLDTLATPTICYVRGTEYEVDDAFGANLIEKNLAAASASDGKSGPKVETLPRQPVRQTMDRPPSVAVENLPPPKSPNPAAEAGPDQTPAQIEKAAAQPGRVKSSPLADPPAQAKPAAAAGQVLPAGPSITSSHPAGPTAAKAADTGKGNK